MKQFQMLGYKMLQVTVEYTKNKSMDHTVSYSCFYLNKDGRKISDSTSERTKLINFFRLYLAFHSNNNINVWHGIFELPVFFLFCVGGIFDLPHLQISIRKAIECVTDVRNYLSRQNKIEWVNMFTWSSTMFDRIFPMSFEILLLVHKLHLPSLLKIDKSKYVLLVMSLWAISAIVFVWYSSASTHSLTYSSEQLISL